jgi:hypothetical protein
VSWTAASIASAGVERAIDLKCDEMGQEALREAVGGWMVERPTLTGEGKGEAGRSGRDSPTSRRVAGAAEREVRCRVVIVWGGKGAAVLGDDAPPETDNVSLPNAGVVRWSGPSSEPRAMC